RTEVRAEEARSPSHRRRPVPQPDPREREDPEERQHDEQVLDEPEPRHLPDDRDVEVALEQRAVPLDEGQAEHQEAPEGEGVRESGYRPREKLALGEHLGRLRADPRTGTGRAARLGRLPRAAEPDQQQRPPPGEPERDGRHRQPQDHPQDHGRQPLRFSISLISAGSTLCRTPTTPKSAYSKMGAFGSLLTATIVREPCIPARCWIAPDTPAAT